jgi:hypothetical protein
MEHSNAFIGKSTIPSSAEVADALGPSAPFWSELIDEVAADVGPVIHEWKAVYVNKYGWSLRLRQKGRNLIHLLPCRNCFRVAFVLGERAVRAAREAHLPKAVAQALATAPHYPEGTGLCLTVSRASDLPAIRKLVKIKQAN